MVEVFRRRVYLNVGYQFGSVSFFISGVFMGVEGPIGVPTGGITKRVLVHLLEGWLIRWLCCEGAKI